MPRSSQILLKILQTTIVIGALAGCTTTPESKPMMMANGKMDMGEMKCDPDMMKDMSPDQKKMMKQCMKMHKDMMGSDTMSMPSDQSAPTADDNFHAQHHPTGSY